MTGRAAAAAAVVLVAAGLGATPAGPAGAAVPSSTSLTVEGAAVPVVLAGYGQSLTAAAQVAVPGSVPDGWVFFVVDGVSRRATLAADGTASTTVEGLDVGTHRFGATFVPRDPAQQDGSSSAETVVEVGKVYTKPVLRISGRTTHRVTRVHARVRTPYDSTATGRLSIALRKRGSAGGRTRNVALEEGTARLALGRLSAGRYRVVVRYTGDTRHIASRQGHQFRVRRR